ncbi:hypothetical protein ABZ078_08775 [Streptomyces sp. NPDC006385]|uniref:hypothetical protein n=1 Tax=Streptomyces sp. NPDC006385 TaxID=3156761 RepID=UPI0033AC3141
MLNYGQAVDWPPNTEIDPHRRPPRHETGSPAQDSPYTGRFTVTRFAIGLRVLDCHHRAAHQREDSRPVWFYGLTDKSCACVMFRDSQPFRLVSDVADNLRRPCR